MLLLQLLAYKEHQSNMEEVNQEEVQIERMD
jgi:hypothetical protein